MEQQPLTYLEKLENLHVLMETREMLIQKVNEIQNEDQIFQQTKEDIRKIEEEINNYTGGQALEMNDMLTHSLFNPAVLNELDEQ